LVHLVGPDPDPLAGNLYDPAIQITVIKIDPNYVVLVESSSIGRVHQ
jgi:hypothetical protein